MRNATCGKQLGGVHYLRCSRIIDGLANPRATVCGTAYLGRRSRSRPRLTGDFGSIRDGLGTKGVVIDVDVTAAPMGVLSGGKNTGGETWGNADYTLNLDTQKMGLWRGGFLNVSVDTSFGTALNNAGGAVPVNAAFLITESNTHTTALMGATYMQFLSPKFGVFIGKMIPSVQAIWSSMATIKRNS